ncbi:hypothetical protein QCM77_17810 [Bradyrhizobium sp. SSUT18]|nr:hypothetical protein [Bradyrhizobium sp. SSUT18]
MNTVQSEALTFHRIEGIKPGHPQQNRRHERMHLTLQLETTKPTAHTFSNSRPGSMNSSSATIYERSHQTLNMQVPAQHYQSSPRQYHGLPDLDYPFYEKAVTVTTCGCICFNRKMIKAGLC